MVVNRNPIKSIERIVSSINTVLYSFASFLHKIISDSLEHSSSHRE